MEDAANITRQRLAIWHNYHQAFADVEQAGKLHRPIVPPACEHNAHMYYLLLPDLAIRTAFIDKLRKQGINTVFHYIPLHSAPEGVRSGRAHGDLSFTSELSDRLVRLPLWVGLVIEQERVIAGVKQFVDGK